MEATQQEELEFLEDLNAFEAEQGLPLTAVLPLEAERQAA